MTRRQRLTANDPEPPAGSVVRTADGFRYTNDGEEHAPANWSSDSGEPETWLKVAGNYGPVTVELFAPWPSKAAADEVEAKYERLRQDDLDALRTMSDLYREAVGSPPSRHQTARLEAMALRVEAADRESSTLRARVTVLEQQVVAIEKLPETLAGESMWLAVQEYFDHDSPWYDPHKGLWAAGVIIRDWMRRAALAAGVVDNPTDG